MPKQHSALRRGSRRKRAATFTAALLALGGGWFSQRKPSGNEPPGSLGLPFIGETLAYAKNPHRFFEERARRFGNVFKTRILGQNIVAFVGPDAFTFFADNPAFDRQGGSPAHVQNLLCQESLPLIDGPKHEQMRRLVLEAFTVEAIQTYLPGIQRIVEEYAGRWEVAGSFAWVDEYKKLSASVCAALLLGARPSADNGADLVPDLDNLLAGLTAIPISLPFTKYGKAVRSRDRLLSLIDDAIGDHQEKDSVSILSRMVGAHDQDGASLTRAQLRAQSLHMFFAAYGGIFRVLSLLSLDLALHPDVRERARQEVGSVTPAGEISLGTLLRLPYLDQVTSEVRRHNRVFASTFFDQVTSDVTYGGHHMPAGWKATGAVYTTMQDGDVFKEPSRFDPERFGPDRVEHQKKQNAYVPQGGGSAMGHRCPAEDLTTHIMKLTAAVLLRSYSWELPPQDLELDQEASPLPKDRIRVTFMALGSG